MAMMVVLVEAGAADVSLHSGAIAELGRLGVTNLGLARDEQTAAVVLEGWAFDPAVSADAAVAALAADGHVRALCPIGEMAVSTIERKGVVAQ